MALRSSRARGDRRPVLRPRSARAHLERHGAGVAAAAGRVARRGARDDVRPSTDRQHARLTERQRVRRARHRARPRAGWQRWSRSGSRSRAGRRRAQRLLRYAAACVCAFVAFDKVLSPQYLLWLIPLVPLVRGTRGAAATGLLTAACVLTQVWFPQRYFDYALHFHLAGVVLAARPRARAAARRARPAARRYCSILTRTSSQLVARPSSPHSTSTPSMRTSPVAGSSRVGMPVTKRLIAPCVLAPDHRVVRAGHARRR